MVQLILTTYNLDSFFLCFLPNYSLLAEKKMGLLHYQIIFWIQYHFHSHKGQLEMISRAIKVAVLPFINGWKYLEVLPKESLDSTRVMNYDLIFILKLIILN